MKTASVDKLFMSWSQEEDEDVRVMKEMNNIYPRNKMVNATTEEWDMMFEKTRDNLRSESNRPRAVTKGA